ncbi:MAG TPA: hypothetical protein VF147_16360, partial [Vicinamibacterales bacterium]
MKNATASPLPRRFGDVLMTRVLIALSVTASVTFGAAAEPIRPLVFSAIDDAPKVTFLTTPATDPY